MTNMCAWFVFVCLCLCVTFCLQMGSKRCWLCIRQLASPSAGLLTPLHTAVSLATLLSPFFPSVFLSSEFFLASSLLSLLSVRALASPLAVITLGRRECSYTQMNLNHAADERQPALELATRATQ